MNTCSICFSEIENDKNIYFLKNGSIMVNLAVMSMIAIEKNPVQFVGKINF